MPKFFILLLTICYLLLAISPVFVYAQSESISFTYAYPIADKEAIDGDIVSSAADGSLIRSNYPYDLKTFGVIQNSPLIAYKSIDETGSPISRSGTATINVTTINGPINPGDYITTSEIPGKGQKATVSGYVVGIAITGLNNNEGTEFSYQTKNFRQGKITVAMQIQYAELTTARTTLRLLDSINTSLFTNIQNPDQFVKIFRYITAIVVVLISSTLGFITLSRSIPKGIEAIGRNPLAQKTIMFSIIINLTFTVIVTLAGITAAIIILRF